MAARARRAVIPVLLAFGLAPCALADMGTPLILAERSHLLLGNAIIGVIEGLLIAALFKIGRRRAIWGMVAANYTSMLVGTFLFNRWAPARLGDVFGRSAALSLTIHNAVSYHITALVVLAVLTALLEWPFCFLIFRPQPKPLWRSAKGCLLAQFVSYAMLCVCYVAPSSLSVVTQTTLADPASFAQARAAWIYYISPTDGTVWRIHPDGSARNQVCDERIENPRARLFFAPSAGSSTCDLRARSVFWPDMEERSLEPNLALDTAVPDEEGTRFDDPTDFAMLGFPMYLDRSLPAAWRVRTPGNWPDHGLRATNSQTGQQFIFAMATPFLRWLSSTPVVLPGDQVVYQLGDQIVLLDLNQRKLGLITLGRGLAVARDRPPASAPATSASSP